ncbi:MAG TPA: glycosyltransferase family 4 protein [Gemmatimonadales bacterium]|jgi:glycosyltransferase involved in cell wall biosynthesis|nr:glycosyltransferase family 4 protein [Gemmatimonadales bacterium]
MPAGPAGPLNILQLTFQGDGAGSTQSIFNLSDHLRRRGHRVILGVRDESLLAKLGRESGIPVVPLDFTRVGPLAARLAEVIATERVDVVNSHATKDRRALTWLRWRGRLRAGFVVTRRTMPRTSPLELFSIGHTADRTIAVSPAVSRALTARWHPGARLRVVPNGIDLARIDQAPSTAALDFVRRSVGDDAGRAVIAIVARRKDQDIAIRALASVERPVVLVCAGVDEDAGLREARATVPERHLVRFVPFGPEALAFYHVARIAALPSRIEGLSQALLEAMALGLPVVASRAGGNPDLVTEDSGMLVDPRDPAAWSAAFSRLLADDGLAARLGAAGRTRVRTEFTLERTAERTEAVYREALTAIRID